MIMKFLSCMETEVFKTAVTRAMHAAVMYHDRFRDSYLCFVRLHDVGFHFYLLINVF